VIPHTRSKCLLRAGAATYPDNFDFHLQALLPLAVEVYVASILSTNKQTLFVYKHWCSKGVNHLEVVWKLARTHTQLHRPHMFHQLSALQVLSPVCYGGQLWLPQNITTVQMPMWPSNHHCVSRWPYGTHSTHLPQLFIGVAVLRFTVAGWVCVCASTTPLPSPSAAARDAAC